MPVELRDEMRRLHGVFYGVGKVIKGEDIFQEFTAPESSARRLVGRVGSSSWASALVFAV
jgi:hypothetical protein